ncbi:S-layer domain protein [Alkaliphilus metalliredigens QYMF]|uniref:S-layer domain protein n=1 Tax=Alkaliphilus metalliredigens (strain QYMF) TaxID=293826 RepID=A6TJR0_ALKMQ|nr:S-layer homology domain-containing protein [Alkaliphilus metalliredigens]ABR46428.1 S-layer domain protein [Alkaliphilus metalliredigens QYMF]
MKKNRKLIMIILTVVMVLATASAAYASSIAFDDINEVPWAKEHIQRMVDKNIISGYVDDSTLKLVFKPANPVTRLESMQLIYKTLQETGQLESSSNYASKYNSILENNNIPWGQPAVAYALEYEIIDEDDLAQFMSNGKQVNATREQIAMYFGRAMASSGDLRQSPNLSFLDSEMINKDVVTYVDFLVRESIISGDNNNRFNPKSTITRAEMAAICSKAYDVLESEPDIIIDISNPNNNNDKEEPAANSKTITRTIEQVNATDYILFAYNDKDQLELYQVERNAVIEIRGEREDLRDLRKGNEAELTFENDKLVKIEVNPQRDRVDGEIRNITHFDDEEYALIVIEDPYRSSTRRTLRVDRSTQVIIFDDESSYDRLEVGDEVVVYYEDNNAIKVEVYEDDRQIVGILDSNISFNRYPFTMEVRSFNNQLITYEIDHDATVQIDNRRRQVEDLKRGDIVTLRMKDGKVTSIDASTTSTGRSNNEEGRIVSLTAGRPNNLIILTEDNEEIQYELADNVVIYLDDSRADFYDLRTNYEVELEIEGGLVTEIEATKRGQNNAIEGEITRFYDSIDRMIVRHRVQSTGRYEETSVYVTGDTVIIDEDGERIEMRHLDRGDEVFVNGSYEDDIFVANRIIVLND